MVGRSGLDVHKTKRICEDDNVEIRSCVGVHHFMSRDVTTMHISTTSRGQSGCMLHLYQLLQHCSTAAVVDSPNRQNNLPLKLVLLGSIYHSKLEGSTDTSVPWSL